MHGLGQQHRGKKPLLKGDPAACRAALAALQRLQGRSQPIEASRARFGSPELHFLPTTPDADSLLRSTPNNVRLYQRQHLLVALVDELVRLGAMPEVHCELGDPMLLDLAGFLSREGYLLRPALPHLVREAALWWMKYVTLYVAVDAELSRCWPTTIAETVGRGRALLL